MPEQQLVEIAKAIGADARIVIMDEPTASLTRARGRRACSASSRALREQGAGIIYISHRLEEIFAIADRITVLRDGADGRDAPTRATSTRAELIRLMVGPRAVGGLSRSGRSPLGDGRARASSACRIAATGVRDVSLSRAARRDPRPRRPGRLGPHASWPKRSSA